MVTDPLQDHCIHLTALNAQRDIHFYTRNHCVYAWYADKSSRSVQRMEWPANNPNFNPIETLRSPWEKLSENELLIQPR